MFSKEERSAEWCLEEQQIFDNEGANYKMFDLIR
jgi:hypothetical protein